MRILVLFTLLCSLAAAPATQPARKRTGPPAASLATAYSGPLKFDPRVLAAERKAVMNPDPAARASTWRYYYSAPSYWYGYGWGYGCYRGAFGWRGWGGGWGAWGNRYAYRGVY